VGCEVRKKDETNQERAIMNKEYDNRYGHVGGTLGQMGGTLGERPGLKFSTMEGGVGGTAPPAPSPFMESADDLMGAIQTLGNVIAALDKRLAPVSRYRGENQLRVNDAKEVGSAPPVIATVLTAARRIRAMRDELDDIIERLAI